MPSKGRVKNLLPIERRSGRLKYETPLDSTTSALVRIVEPLLGGREAIIERLEAASPLSEALEALLAKLKRTRRSFAEILGESDAAPLAALRAIVKGQEEISRLHASLIASERVPALVEDIASHAIDERRTCTVCAGKSAKDSLPCEACWGSGEERRSSAQKEWSAKLLAKMGKVVDDEAATKVNVAVGVKVEGHMESLLKEAFAPPALKGEVVEAAK